MHPEWLAAQAIDPATAGKEKFWKRRYEAITAWEEHLHRSGTRMVKLFLHVSRDEQRKRFLKRTGDPEKQWKFYAADVAERAHWDAYQAAYEAALRATSTKRSPWYVIPADHKWFMRTAVAAVLAHHLDAMDPQFPVLTRAEKTAMRKAAAALEAE